MIVADHQDAFVHQGGDGCDGVGDEGPASDFHEELVFAETFRGATSDDDHGTGLHLDQATFHLVDRIEQLRDFLDRGAERFEVGPDGEPAHLQLKDVGSAAVLVVAASTDALKQVARGRVEDSVDRSEVWEVVGMSIDREVAVRLLEAGFSGDLLTGVPEMGIEWAVIDRPVAP